MTRHTAATSIAGRFASNPGGGNRPNAEFFKRQAINALRQAQTMIGYAEREQPGSTDGAYLPTKRAVMILEATRRD